MAIDDATLAAAVQNAIDGFAASMTVEEPNPQPTSHRSFKITILEDEASVQNIGRYLVGLVLQVVSEDLRILGEAVPPDAAAWATVKADLDRLIGASNNIDADFRSTRRDPWIMEALTRLIVHASDATTTGFPTDIVAVTRVTPNVTRSGLDLVGIYRAPGTLDFVVGEVKATRDNLNGNLSECYSTFKQVAKGHRSLELRTHLQTLALPLGAADRERVAKMMYSAHPVLIPIVSHGPSEAFNAGRQREKLRAKLAAQPERLRFVICPIAGYLEFFDGVAEAMRSHVTEMMA